MNTPSLRAAILLCVSACSLIFFSGCATQKAEYYTKLTDLIVKGNYSEAAALAETSKHSAYGEKDALLFYLDRGMLLQLCAQYDASNQAFEKAKNLSDEFFTKSITTEASTLLVNDTMRPYYGEDFERALVHMFCALNYVELGNEDDALVEARQIDHLFTTLQTNYGSKDVFKDEPFAHYLMGMLYENQRDFNDAYIEYYKALTQYRDVGIAPPTDLIREALRYAKKLGMSDDVADIQKTWNVQPATYAASNGEIIVLHYNGLAPVKTNTFFEISFGEAWGYVGYVETSDKEEADVEQATSIARTILAEEQVRIAFPKYIDSPYTIKNFSVVITSSSVENVGTEAEYTGVLVENVGALAKQSLDARIARIRIRAIARAAIKYALAKKISDHVQQQSQSNVLGWVTKTVLSVAANATEVADTRCWRSLPDQIQMVRLSLPPGTYTLHLTFRDDKGAVISEKILQSIRVTQGKKIFATVRTAT